MELKCDCCGGAGIQGGGRPNGPKPGEKLGWVWHLVGKGCETCIVAENEDTWVVWCVTHQKALYPSDSGAFWDYEKGVPK